MSGRIENLRRGGVGEDGFVQATGTFLPVEGLRVMFGRTADIEREVKQQMRLLSVVVPVGGVPTTMTICEESKLNSEKVTVKVCPQSLHKFLRYCVRRHASAPAKWPRGVYGKILELVHAFDPDALALQVDRFRNAALRTQMSVLQILPQQHTIAWALSFEDIAANHEISVSTVKRRVRKHGIKVFGVHPPRILRREYDRKKTSFERKSTTSAYSSSTRGFRSGHGFTSVNK